MRNSALWQPSKFVSHRAGWRAARDPAEVFVGSRIVTDLVAATYPAQLAAHARGAMLDIGCGKVPLYGAYRDLVSSTTCVDWPGSLHGTLHVDEFADLNAPLPLPDGAYDTILCSDVIEHLWNHDGIWREMARVLAPGGALILGTPFTYWLHEEPHDYFRWTPHALRRWAEASGLDVVQIQRVGGACEVMADTLSKVAALASPRLARPLTAVLAACLRTRLARRVSRATPAMPLTLLLVARKPSA